MTNSQESFSFISHRRWRHALSRTIFIAALLLADALRAGTPSLTMPSPVMEGLAC